MTLRATIGLVVILPLTVGFGLAETLTQSLVPHLRPLPVANAPSSYIGVRPKPRPANLAVAMPVVAAIATPAPAQKPAASAKGSVCGNSDIRGVALQAINPRMAACTIPAPVSVTAIDGVKLVPGATINCNEAQALAIWINAGLQPQFKNQVARLLIADSYSCRPRNNVRGAKMSEHGSGNAIDISGLVLTTGQVLTVSSNFNGQLRAAYRAACGTFHTTLGPGSDGYHENHMHLDVARYRGHPYCR